MLFFSFSKKYRPFEHLKCHECLWCEFFDDCKSEFDYAKSWDDVTSKDNVYGKSVSMNPAYYVDWNAMDDYLNKHL